MLAGISTSCFYPEATENALGVLAGHGVETVEVFLNSFSELEPAYLRELRRIADGGGVRILSLHPFTSGMESILFFSRYMRRFEDGREFYKRYYEAACILSAEILVFHGASSYPGCDPEEYLDRFGVLIGDAEREGVRLCHENVSRCVGSSPRLFERLAGRFPNAGFVFDVKQAVRSGVDIMEFARTMGKNIAHIHISDHDGEHDCLTPGAGTFNVPEFLCFMRDIGFDGGVIVELYRDNFAGIVELFSGYQLVCRSISTLA